MCFLFNTCCWFINIELLANSTCNSCLNEACLTQYVFYKAHCGHLALRNIRQDFIMFGAILNSKITKEKHKHAKNVALNEPRKGQQYGNWNKKAERCHVLHQLRTWASSDSNFSLSCAGLQMTRKIQQVLIWGFQKNLASRWLAYKESMNNKAINDPCLLFLDMATEKEDSVPFL